eukprot:2901574-Pleurochrysis_carterae.AAC.1
MQDSRHLGRGLAQPHARLPALRIQTWQQPLSAGAQMRVRASTSQRSHRRVLVWWSGWLLRPLKLFGAELRLHNRTPANAHAREPHGHVVGRHSKRTPEPDCSQR